MAGRLITRLLQDDSGATAIEYGLIAVLMSISGAAIWNVLGFRLVLLYAEVAAHLGFSGVITAG